MPCTDLPLRSSLLSALLFLAACTAAPAVKQSAADQPVLKLTGRVVDAASVLTAKQALLLTSKLAALEAHEGVQFVVATTPSLKGEEIDSYSLRLAKSWALGDKGRNDGLLLLVAPNERKVRIEVGLGLETTLPDELCQQVIEGIVLPRFIARDLPGGIDAGVDALISELNVHMAPAKAKAA